MAPSPTRRCAAGTGPQAPSPTHQCAPGTGNRDKGVPAQVLLSMQSSIAPMSSVQVQSTPSSSACSMGQPYLPDGE